MSRPYGLEWFHRIVSRDLRSKNDALISLLHSLLISKRFNCVGIGEQPNTSDRRSELLPDGWNDDQSVYTLRYVNEADGKIYLLKAVAVDNTVIVSLLNTSNNKVASVSFVTDSVIAEPLLDFNSVYRDVPAAVSRLTTELLAPVGVTGDGQQGPAPSRAAENRAAAVEQNRVRDDDSDPLRVPTRNPYMQPAMPYGMDPDDPFSVGRNDLDPFGGMGRGGGMLMDPRGLLGRGIGRGTPGPGMPNMPGQLPRGAIPPGARFDPFGPDMGPRGPRGAGPRFAGPDSDHLPPPGYDDMFS